MALETLAEAQERLTANGFRADLVVADGGLRDLATGHIHDPGTLKVVELVRFEGASDPDDEAVMLAVATRDGDAVGTLTVPFGPGASAEEAEVLRHLHRVVATERDVAEHDPHDHVVGVLPDRTSAEAAVADLREVGLGGEHLGVAVRHGDHAAFERDEESDLVHDVEGGAATGAAVGFLAGMGLFGLIVPGVGTLAVGGLAAMGLATGFAGSVFGGLIGVAAGTGELESHQALREMDLAPGEVLLVACGHHHEDLVAAAIERHGGRLVVP